MKRWSIKMKKTIKGQTILTISLGNKKLVGDAENAFMIWNLPAVSTCPNRTALCEKSCYAMKAQRLYPSVKMSREANLEDSKNPEFVNQMIDTINYYLLKKAVKGKTVWFRIHESGDLYSLEYAKNWVKIAEAFPEINFTAYTKSIYIIKALGEIPANLVVRFSIWDDTKPEHVEMAKTLNLPIYTAFIPELLEKKVVEENYTKCDCDCSKCKMCYSPNIQKLAVAIH